MPKVTAIANALQNDAQFSAGVCVLDTETYSPVAMDIAPPTGRRPPPS